MTALGGTGHYSDFPILSTKSTKSWFLSKNQTNFSWHIFQKLVIFLVERLALPKFSPKNTAATTVGRLATTASQIFIKQSQWVGRMENSFVCSLFSSLLRQTHCYCRQFFLMLHFSRISKSGTRTSENRNLGVYLTQQWRINKHENRWSFLMRTVRRLRASLHFRFLMGTGLGSMLKNHSNECCAYRSLHPFWLE